MPTATATSPSARRPPRSGSPRRPSKPPRAPVKVLALYDIHGNVDALEAVLADPRAAGPDAVVVGGDAVPGPFARATLDRLERLPVPVHWVRGNGEREGAEAVGPPPPPREDAARWTAAVTAAELGD